MNLMMALLTLMLLLGSSVSWAGALHVEATHDEVILEAADVQTEELLDAFARAIGAEVRGTMPRNRSSTVAIHATSVEDALRQMLGAESFALRYRKDGTVRRIDLIAPDGEGAPAPADFVAPESQTDPSVQHPVRVSRRLGRTLGTAHPNLGAVIDSMITQADPALRGDALLAVARALNEDAGLMVQGLPMLQSLDDDVLAVALQRISGADAARMARRISRETTVPWLRDRMAGVSARLSPK